LAEGGLAPVTNIPDDLATLLINMSAKEDISPDDRIYHDLGIRGEDAAELVNFMYRQYGVDFSRLQFNNFFFDEGLTLRDLWAVVTRFPKSAKQEVTVSDLVRICQSGVWDL
jgi:hypothetical protein